MRGILTVFSELFQKGADQWYKERSEEEGGNGWTSGVRGGVEEEGRGGRDSTLLMRQCTELGGKPENL